MSQTREMLQDGIADAKNENSIIKPYMMSHGTMECFSLEESRRFYEEFLGLECVKHAPAGDGRPLRPQIPHRGRRSRQCRASLQRAQSLGHRRHLEGGGRSGACGRHPVQGQVQDPPSAAGAESHGIYSFYLEDLDHNWWEIRITQGSSTKTYSTSVTVSPWTTALRSANWKSSISRPPPDGEGFHLVSRRDGS